MWSTPLVTPCSLYRDCSQKTTRPQAGGGAGVGTSHAGSAQSTQGRAGCRRGADLFSSRPRRLGLGRVLLVLRRSNRSGWSGTPWGVSAGCRRSDGVVVSPRELFLGLGMLQVALHDCLTDHAAPVLVDQLPQAAPHRVGARADNSGGDKTVDLRLQIGIDSRNQLWNALSITKREPGCLRCGGGVGPGSMAW